MTNRKINIGVMGGSSFAERMMMPVIKNLDDHFNLIAIASRSATKAEDLAQRFSCKAVVGYQELLEMEAIEAIYCPLPTGLHFEWGRKALDHGKHLILEKSLTSDFDSAKILLEKAKELNLCVMENFMFQYHNQQGFVKKQIADGVIGEVRNFQSAFGFPPFPDQNNIRYQKALGGGALLDAGAYTVKAAQYFLGLDLTVKAASLSQNADLGVDLFGGAFLESEKGIPIQLSFGFDNYYQCNYEIWGSKGKITATRAFTAKPDFEPTILIQTNQGTQEYKHPKDNQYQKLFMVFHKAISENSFSDFFEPNLNQARIIHQIFNYAN